MGDLNPITSQETHLKCNTERLEVKEWKQINHANNNKKKAGTVVSIPDKLDLNAKSTFRIKEKYFIMLSH